MRGGNTATLFCFKLASAGPFFPVRDSPDDFANVTLWLERDTADEYDSLYHVGDVVQLSNPKVVAKDPSDPQERNVLL